MKFAIPVENMESLDKKMYRIQRKAEKNGLNFVYEKLGKSQVETKVKGVFYEVENVEISGLIKFGGWNVVAVLKHEVPGKNVVCMVDDTIPLPEKYRTCNSYCEHCHTLRNRNKTVVLFDGKQYKQVGTDCLKEFTGGISAEMIADYESYIKSAEETMEGSYGAHYFALETLDFLCGVKATISMFGWTSRKSIEEWIENNPGKDCNMIATSNLTINFFCNNRVSKSNYDKWVSIKDNPDTEKFCRAAIEWAKEQGTNDSSEFMWNMSIEASKDYISIKDIGIASCIPMMYDRFIERENKKKAETEKFRDYGYYGNIGDSVEVEGHLSCVSSFGTQFGVMFIYKMIAKNCVFVWKTSKEIEMLDDGIDCVLSGKIKELSEFRGIKQNVLTRCKITVK